MAKRVSIEQLRAELNAAGERREVDDLCHILRCRENPPATQAEVVDLRRAENRQGQRRFQRRVSRAKHLVEIGDTLRCAVGSRTFRLANIERRGNKLWLTGVLNDVPGDDMQYGAMVTPSDLDAMRLEPAAGAELSLAVPLAASVAIEASRAFLVTLDAFVAGDEDEISFNAARAELENALSAI